MLLYEFKVYGKESQYRAIDDAIRTAQFVQNKCLRYWMDTKGLNGYDLNKYTAVLAKEFPFANELNSTARQASAERTWAAISRFYENCRKPSIKKKGFPKFKKDTRSVEYKHTLRAATPTGWKLSVDEVTRRVDRKTITFKDGKKIGTLKIKGTRDLNFYQFNQIKRVRLVRRADGYYCQFCIQIDRVERIEPSGNTIGLDVGLKEFYADSNGVTVENPRFLRKAEKVLKRSQKRVSRKVKSSRNRHKARRILGKRHLKISRQRIDRRSARRVDHAVKLARCVITSNDVVAYEDLRIKNMVKNHCLAKSINDASWYQFRMWLEYFAKVFGKITIAVNPQYTSQECSSCGTLVKKTLSTRTHSCKCGCTLDRDHNAAINILRQGLSTVGHTGTFALFGVSNASGDVTSTLAGEILLEQVVS